MKTEPRYNYTDHGNDRYYGKALLSVTRCGAHSKRQFRIHEAYLARNSEGMLGFLGNGPKWFLNWVTDTGACCFNPVEEDDLVWSLYHNAYIYKSQKEHFLFPVIMGEFYYLEDGVKKTGGCWGKEVVPKLPEVRFPKRSEYF